MRIQYAASATFDIEGQATDDELIRFFWRDGWTVQRITRELDFVEVPKIEDVRPYPTVPGSSLIRVTVARAGRYDTGRAGS